MAGRALTAGLVGMASVAVISAVVPGFARVIEAAFAAMVALAVLVPAAAAGRRTWAVMARRRLGARRTALRWMAQPAPVAAAAGPIEADRIRNDQAA